MKRIICSLLVVVMLIIPFALYASAAEAVSISGSQIKCQPGQTIDIEIKVSANSNIAATNIDLSYDSSKLSFLKYSSGDIIKGAMADGNGKTAGKVKYAIVTLTPITEAGTLFHTFFTVNASASGEQEIKLAVNPIVDINSKALDVKITNTVVAVSGSPVASSDPSAKEIEVITENGTTTIPADSASSNDVPSFTKSVESQNSASAANASAANASAAGSETASSNFGKIIIIIAACVVAAVAIAVVIILIVGKKSKKTSESESASSILTDDALKDFEEDLQQSETDEIDEPDENNENSGTDEQ